MTRAEAVEILGRVKWAMVDMRMHMEVHEAERAEMLLYDGRLDPAERRALADYLVPPGRRGRVTLVLRRPEEARARAFVAAVLRAVEGP